LQICTALAAHLRRSRECEYRSLRWLPISVEPLQRHFHFRTGAIVMTRLNRGGGLAAAAIGLFLLSSPALTATSASAANSGVAPFCIAYGGGGEGGGGRTEDCRYFDWQACLQAAASRGNCVQNIDYHGTVSTTSTAPTAAPVRSRRRH
jgi:hypothetical protein